MDQQTLDEDTPVKRVKAARLPSLTSPAATMTATLLTDKIMFDRVLAGAGLPTPKLHGVANPHRFVTFNPPGDRPLRDAAHLLDGQSLFCKPARSKGGQGSFTADIQHGKVHVGGQVLSSDEFGVMLAERAAERGARRSSRRVIVQERVRNHRRLAAVGGSSLNTMRLLTHYKGDRPEPFSAVLRFGTGDSMVDNWFSGGLAVHVDVSSGRTRGDAIRKADLATFSRHPDSGKKLDGIKVPHFRDAVDAARLAHQLIPDLLTVGWDIALTPDGPVILEGNTRWSITLHWLTDPGFYDLAMGELFA